MTLHSQAFIDYLAHYHGDRDYFECHEILEEYWKEVDNRNKQSIWVGLIQIAVANYHHRRGNFHGAKKTLQKAVSILSSYQREVIQLGIDYQQLLNDIHKMQEEIDKGRPYKSYYFPITDAFLLDEVKKTCISKGFEWGQESNLENEDIVHRHMKRDRSNVIAERERALQRHHR
ncbi:DUF309 domain-containing protein [Cytobacillus sp. FSL K6-0265]|uniref:DUF309 domain-containing protein n=1 Tax=Cytobacillus sp. FSL K6-0265 TaxID=2921448 RepID=UPI0030F94128